MSQRERAATREALIEVARLMVERDGEPALTLGAVADEAGLARATVYGFFSGRSELLDALDPSKPAGPAPFEARDPPPQAEEGEAAIWTSCQPDLSEFLPESAVSEEPVETAEPVAEPAIAADADGPETAGTPADDIVPPAEEESVAPADAACEEQIVADATAEPAEDEPAAPPALDAPAEEPIVADEPASLDERRRLQAAHLEEIAKRLILPESALKEGTDAVIGRLDTRIRVLEKSIASLETRQNADGTDGARKLRGVADALEQLQARADSADAKPLQAISELRLGIHQLESRLRALETDHPGEAIAWPEPEPEPAQSALPETQQDAESEATEGAPADNARHAYLSTVRSLAKEGARQAAERETLNEAERQARRRRMVAAAGVAVVCLGVIGVLFVFHPGAHGVTQAQSRPGPLSAVPHAAALAPLDRLSALARSGNADAELLVGLRYLPRDEALAARWLQRAAQKNNAIAQNALGALYQNGRGVKPDPARAAQLYERSAAQGNRHAMSNLAVLYAGGDGKSGNFAEAARWFLRAANLGYVDAAFNLAVLYERGDGVPQSLLDAYKWYSVAAISGDAVAKTRADAIATQISADELAAAQKAVVEFKPLALNRAANDVPAMATVLAAR